MVYKMHKSIYVSVFLCTLFGGVMAVQYGGAMAVQYKKWGI
jgi:hypothetical protein